MTVLQPSPDWQMVTLKWAGVYIDGRPADGFIELAYNSDQPLLDDDTDAGTPLSVFVTPMKIPIATKTVPFWTGDYDPETDEIVPETGTYEPRTVGYVEVQVPASNDPDVIGGGGTYRFTELLNDGAGRRNVNFVADRDAPSNVIWINRLPGGTPPVEGDAVIAVYISDFNDLAARVTVLEEGGVGGGVSSWNDLTDKPTTFPPSTHSLDVTTDSGTRLAMTPVERAKLVTVQENATQNAADGELRDRSTHTGSQTAETISDLQESVEDAVAAFFDRSTHVGISWTYDDEAGTISGTVAGAGGGDFDAEDARDTIGVALLGVGNISVSVNDEADTITISTIATQNATDAQLRDRSTHSGSQDISTIDGLAAALSDLTSGVNARALDNAVVKLTGNQSISGTKTFTAAPAVPDGSFGIVKLSGVEPSRTTVSQAEAEAGTATTVRGWTAQRVAQAIAGYIAANTAAIKTALGIAPAPVRFSASTASVASTGSDRADVARTITSARMRVSGAPVGSALTVQVQHSTDGASWTTVATLSVAAGSTTEAVSGALSQAQAVGNLIRLNVTSVGSTTPATGVVVDVVVQ